jgi:transitional endoplasmic reticulum ATPase
VDPRLRAPDLCDRELGLSLPDGATRKALLEVLLRDVPAADLQLNEIADRTPGFVRADLAALVREAALRAAARASEDNKPPTLTQEDLVGALSVIRPLSRCDRKLRRCVRPTSRSQSCQASPSAGFRMLSESILSTIRL